MLQLPLHKSAAHSAPSFSRDSGLVRTRSHAVETVHLPEDRMGEVGENLAPNLVAAELHNLVVVLFVCLFVLWTFRLCRNGLHLQDLRAGSAQNLVRSVFVCVWCGR